MEVSFQHYVPLQEVSEWPTFATLYERINKLLLQPDSGVSDELSCNVMHHMFHSLKKWIRSEVQVLLQGLSASLRFSMPGCQGCASLLVGL